VPLFQNVNLNDNNIGHHLKHGFTSYKVSTSHHLTKENTVRNIHHRSWPHLIGSLLVLLVMVWGSVIPSQAQSNPLRIRKTVVGGLTQVKTGQTFQYRVTASCNNLTNSCGDLTLIDDLPPGLTLVGISGPVEPAPAASAAIKYVYQNDTPAVGELTIRNKRGAEVGAGEFQDGEIVEFLITVRVDLNAVPGTLDNSLTGDVTQGDIPGDPVPVPLPPVTITLLPPLPPAANGSDWTYTKAQVIPVPPQNPTTGQPTLYNITVCPVTRIGVLPYTGLTITDTYPTGATVLDNGGGTVTPPQISWAILDAEVLNALTNNTCITRTIILRYDTPTFSVPTTGLTNGVSVDANECTTVCGGSTVTFNLVNPVVDVSTQKSISGSPVGEGGVGRFFLNVNPNQGNVPAPNLELFDDIDETQVRVTEIQSGAWAVLDPLLPFVTVRATVRITDDIGGVTTSGPFTGANTVVTPLPVPPRSVSEVRWIFEYDPDGPGPSLFQPGLPLGFQMGEPPEIVFTPRTNPPFTTAFTPGTYPNCANATFTGGAGTATNCVNYVLGDPGVTGTNIDTSKTSPTGQTDFTPLQEFPLELRLRLSERARLGDTIVNPSIIDTLPPQLEFVSWDSVTFVNVPGGPHPMPFFRQTGSNLQWYWQTAPLVGSVQPAPAGLPNTVSASGSTAFTMTANGTDQDVIVRFTVRIAPTVAPNPVPDPFYTNTAYFIGPDTPICENGTLGDETSFGIDDGDGIPEQVCQTGFDFRVRKALALEGFKWIRNGNYAATPPRFPEFALYNSNTVSYNILNATTGESCTNPNNYFEYPAASGQFWVRYPCVAFGFPESPLTALPPTGAFTPAAPNDDQFEYLLDVRNSGNVRGQDYYLYDMLPRIGDTGSGGPLSSTPRGSRFATYLTGPVTLDASSGLTGGTPIIEYSIDPNPCRTEVFDDPAQGACNNTWSTILPADTRTVTAYRIHFDAATRINIGGRMLFRVPMLLSYDAQYGNGQIAWNSFAHTAINEENAIEGFLPPAEPRKVGIRVPERLSIGNRVWRDSDNSGTINAPDNTNPGITGVTVNLYADFDGNGVPDGAAIASELTDADGYYLFDNIFPDANPNNNRYVVGIPASNFGAVQPLFNLRSSTGPANVYVTPPEGITDSDDNGWDEVPYVPPSGEILSATINLLLYNEQTNEGDLSANPRDGAFSRGTRGEANFNSDLTIDFGFFGGADSPFSIGNRIFYDDGNNGAGFTPLMRDNGLQDGNELGVNGVRVELYRDGNGNNQPDANELIKFDITAAGTVGLGRPGANLDGYYLFDNLDVGTYFVVIPASEFGVGDPLGGWHSSTFNGTELAGAAGAVGTPATDLDDNGIEPANARPDLSGVRSGAIVLARGVPEVTGETDLSLEPDPGTPNANDPLADPQTLGIYGPTVWDGPNSIGRWTLGTMADTESNVAVDFGFIPPMSIGNRVWLDDTNDPANWSTTRNNGLIDATDDGNLTTAGLDNPGIANVDIILDYDINNDGDFADAGETGYRTTTTAANGYYLFDGLRPGSYQVRIPSSEFGAGQPLNGLISSFDAAAQATPTDQIDSNDNGVDNAAPATNGISSTLIQLVYLTEAALETDPNNPQVQTDRGRFGEADTDSDLTIDFGFVRPPRSIGNRLWFDVNNNGILDGGELPVPTGVAVSLYLDANGDGVPDGAAIRTDTTDANGFYLFENLPPLRYLVGVDQSNFIALGLLEEYTSSTGNVDNASSNLDNRDNGVDRVAPQDAALSPNGILSTPIDLRANPLVGLPTGEAGSGNPADNIANGSRGNHGETDGNSDLTIDFGFFKPMSIGNRVFRDDGTGGGTINNGIQDTNELGIANVRVELWRETNGTAGFQFTGGTPDTLVTFDTTDATGYYLFDRLISGTYFVRLPATNFVGAGPLLGLFSSIPTGDETTVGTVVGNPNTPVTDRDDNGVNDSRPDLNGVNSGAIVLTVDSEPTGEADLSGQADPGAATRANNGPTGWDGPTPGSRGRWNESDDNSNLTIDFGFIPPMSLGNRVWLDNGAAAAPTPINLNQFNDGLQNGTEAGIDSVLLNLYFDSDYSGTITGVEATTPYLTTTTANGGYYLFDRLPPGLYRVQVAPSNFTGAGVLLNLISSLDSVQITPPAENNEDMDDNGIDDAAPATNGISSSLFTLYYNTEPLTAPLLPTEETDISTNTATYGAGNRGLFGQLDGDSNLTLDFGFIPPPRSLGNRVWIDTDNSGTINGAEVGIQSVNVSLYLDNDATPGVPDDINIIGDRTDDALRTDITDVGGYYLFDKLPPARYLVGVDRSNFATGGLLEEYTSSTGVPAAAAFTNPPASNGDSNDNGIDRLLPADAILSPNGILSASINLTANPLGGPTGELDLSGDNVTPNTFTNGPTSWDGPTPGSRGRFGETDGNSDLTIDFGFFKPMSIGNRVFRDNGTGTINNGIMDAAEAGIGNVRVELYRDDNSGVFDAGDTLVTFDVTDANGFYLFDQLPAGNYFVHIPSGNFGPAFDVDGGGPLPLAPGALFGYSSSIPTGTEDTIGTVVGNLNTPVTDRDDNGVNAINPTTTGVSSGLIVLAVDSEPANETELSGQANPNNGTEDDFGPTGWDGPTSDGRWNQSADNSNLTIDFGFIPPMSIGNRVWLDSGAIAGPSTDITQYNNGLMDGVEPGIGGVTVNLYFDTNYNNIIDPAELVTPFRTTTTNNNGGTDVGYYLFDALQPGLYRVQIDPSNFAGGPLTNLISSMDINQASAPADDGQDTDDNGVDSPTYLANGIFSSDIVLTLNVESIGETDIAPSNAANNLAFGTNRIGRFGELNFDSDVSIDFGFIAPPRSLGNRVWFDDNNSGTIDAGDRTNLAGVRVSLYLDNDNDGTPDDLGVLGNRTDDWLRFDNTDPGGYYLFDNLPPQRYIVGVDAGNFAAAAVLEEYGSSIGPNPARAFITPAGNNGDLNDNGINQADPANLATAPYGVISASIDLTPNGPLGLNGPTLEPTSLDTTTTLGNNQTAGDGLGSIGRFGELDRNSDLTIDFGFFKAMSIGNRIWLDNSVAGYNNGILDAGEVGIAGVRVELYLDNGDGIFNAGDTFLAFDTTDGGGYYLFDGLIPGTYFVFIPKDNFIGAADNVPTDPLATLNNSSPVGVTPTQFRDDRLDSNDVGVNENFPELNGVVSVPFILARDSEPVVGGSGEFDNSFDTGVATTNNPTAGDGPNHRGRNNESDDNSNLTADMGFVGPVFSIGNRVWADIDNSGTITPGDDANPLLAGDQPGIPGVRVVLYRDGGDNVFNAGTDIVVNAKNTDANGYYLFDNLPSGNYFVWIDQVNFRVVAGIAQPLFDWYSSTLEAVGDFAAPSTDLPSTDNDDNGINDLTPDLGGIVSPLFRLTKNDEPIGGVGANDEDNTTGTITQGLSGNPLDGPVGQSRGTHGEIDSDSNLTVDFGFYRPLSVGNRVWFDANGNGLIDVLTEAGIAGVRVELYRDNGDSTFTAADTFVKFDTTDATGYYLFDNLPPGSYFVHIPLSNFGAGQPLNGRESTTTNNALGVDLNDNGDDNELDGVTSTAITLAVSYNNLPNPQKQPINEGDLSSDIGVGAGDNPTNGDGPNKRGRFGETDGNSDLTIDFGFVGAGMSLGNRVWFDGNNNGLIDAATSDDFVAGGPVAPGIPGVTVRLYRDSNADGIPDSAVAVVPDQVTNASGYYLFENIQPGTYVVGLVNSNFSAGGVLVGLISSTTTGTEDTGIPGNPNTPNTDSDDNGVDAINVTFGLLSSPVVLVLNGEPTTEADLGTKGNGTVGATPITADNSQLTVDFGLYRPMSLGNRLWFDTNSNAVQDGSESGVPAGVTLGLYRDDNNDNLPDGPSIATTTTDATGHYLFGGLGTGRYIVIVEAVNFQAGNPLENYLSSIGADGTTTTDRNDNGIDDVTPQTNGIRSNVVTLTPNTSPTNDETDLSGNPIDGPNSRGTNGETNNNSNLTIDFGFVTSVKLSIGNLVWLDTNRNGIVDAAETPFANVRVNLYRDVNTDGIPDDLGAPGPTGDVIATDTTDAEGHYLFDNLAPGNYIVELAAANFNPASVLDGYGSTTTLAPDTNNQDNGIDTANTVNGIRSGTITLSVGGEPATAAVPSNPDDNEVLPGANAKGYGVGVVDANGNMTVDFGLYRPLSIGNRVWFDTDANGLINGTENGIPGVVVELHPDVDNNGVFDPLIVIVVAATDTTDSLGYYLFGNLIPGTYFVYIRPDQFTGAGVLTGFASTIDGSSTTDNDDNGVSDGGTGIVSGPVVLTENGAPTTETDFSGDAVNDGPRFIGKNGENNRNSDISVDFGFTATPMSLGNRVWFDANDNGYIDAGDDFDKITAGDQPGIPGVRVNLYADSNQDGTPDGGIIRSDTTDANGFYLFDNLPPGSYLVQIAPSNFATGGVLRGLYSSTGNDIANPGNTIGDSNDNGIDNINAATLGIFSGTIVLTPTPPQPTGETDLSGNATDGPVGESRGTNGESDDHSNLTIDFGFSTRFDWGDAPDTYQTTNAAGGPSHVIVNNLFMGSIVDDEPDGQPSVGADGDDTNGVGGDDEDGVTIPKIIAGTRLDVQVVVFNNTGIDARLVGWIDVNGDGVFTPGEAFWQDKNGNGTFDAGEDTITVPSSAAPQTLTLSFNIPTTADIDTGGSLDPLGIGTTYARFRLTTDPLTAADWGGAARDGEIEDYRVRINPPGVSITKTDGKNSIVVGQSTTYTITIQYSGLTGITRVLDDVVSPAGAFTPASVTWTCDANLQASCITGQPLGTDITTPTAGLMVGQSIDLQQGGQLVYKLTGTLRPDYDTAFPGIPNVVNTVSLDSGEKDFDDNGVIFDPPFGVKSGVAINANTIRWTMVWFNTGLPQAVSINDVLDPGQTNPTNLVCTGFGTTTKVTDVPPAICEVQGGNTIFWSGTLGDGTTSANRSANRLQIVFDVTVPGPGNYRNLAALTPTTPLPGSPSITARNIVTIPGPGVTPPTDEPGTSGPGDPVISKQVDPPFAQPGDIVTWKILVYNPGDIAIPKTAVTDGVPDSLEILSTLTTKGSVSVNGQVVILDIAPLDGRETVTLTIKTRIRKDAKVTEIRNLADLYTPDKGKIQTAEASVLMVKELPQTGELPLSWFLIRGLIMTIIGGAISLSAFRVYRIRRTQ